MMQVSPKYRQSPQKPSPTCTFQIVYRKALFTMSRPRPSVHGPVHFRQRCVHLPRARWRLDSRLARRHRRRQFSDSSATYQYSRALRRRRRRGCFWRLGRSGRGWLGRGRAGARISAPRQLRVCIRPAHRRRRRRGALGQGRTRCGACHRRRQLNGAGGRIGKPAERRRCRRLRHGGSFRGAAARWRAGLFLGQGRAACR